VTPSLGHGTVSHGPEGTGQRAHDARCDLALECNSLFGDEAWSKHATDRASAFEQTIGAQSTLEFLGLVGDRVVHEELTPPGEGSIEQLAHAKTPEYRRAALRLPATDIR
jgi:hypothetical protein